MTNKIMRACVCALLFSLSNGVLIGMEGKYNEPAHYPNNLSVLEAAIMYESPVTVMNKIFLAANSGHELPLRETIIAKDRNSGAETLQYFHLFLKDMAAELHRNGKILEASHILTNHAIAMHSQVLKEIYLKTWTTPPPTGFASRW